MNKWYKAVIFHRFFYIFLIIISCSTKPEKDWTILIYMAADNSLNENALLDIQEMVSAEFSDELNVIVQIDHRNQNPIQDYTGAERFKITSGSKKKISEIGEIDSGSPESLSDFFDWGLTHYKADHYGAFIWSHGNGWYDSYNKFCPDNNSASSISIAEHELQQAFANVNHKFDILVFDACNMQCMEVATEIYSYTNFIIGSEEAIKSSGFPYHDILSQWEEYDDSENVARMISDSFTNSYFPYTGSQNPEGDLFSFSCSTIQTGKFSLLLNAMYEKLSLIEIDHSILSEIRSGCMDFNDPEMDIDIKQFFTLLQTEIEISEISLAIDNSFIYNRAYVPSENNFYLIERSEDLGFATLWFPEQKNHFENNVSYYGNLDFSFYGWEQFLISYFENE